MLVWPSDRGFQIADRFKRAAKRRRRLWIERVFLCLYRASRSRIRPTGKALRDKPSCPGFPRGGQQIIRTLGAQPVGLGESSIEITQIDPLDGRELVNHDFRLSLPHRVHHGGWIKCVGDDRRGANSPQKVSFGGRTRQSGDLVPRRRQQWDKAAANRSRRSRDKNFHCTEQPRKHQKT